MEASLNGLKSLGNEIRSAKYSTTHSQWTYTKPQAVSALEHGIDQAWTQLAAASATKAARLGDELQRQLYAEHTRLLAGQHADKFEACRAWASEKTEFLKSPAPVTCIDDAQGHISLLDSYRVEKNAFTSSVMLTAVVWVVVCHALLHHCHTRVGGSYVFFFGCRLIFRSLPASKLSAKRFLLARYTTPYFQSMFSNR